MAESSKNTKSTKKPLLKSLKGSFTITDELRRMLQLPKVLRLEVKYWPNPELVIADYFSSLTNWGSNPNFLYSILMNSLSKISSSDECPASLKSYAKAVLERYKNSTIKREFFEEYTRQERLATLKKEENKAITEGKITGAKLSRQGAKNFGDRQNIFDDSFEVDNSFVDNFFNAEFENQAGEGEEEEKEEKEKEEGEGEEGEEEGEEYDNDFLQTFHSKFLLMKNDKKWMLSDGTYVEDKLYNFGMHCSFEHLCHSWILDPDDKSYLLYKVFSEKQLKEIKAIKPVHIPEISDELADYLNKFNNVKNTSDLRQLLMVRSFYQCYDPKKHADMDWICRTLDNLLPLYEIEGNFKRANNERWYQNRIWTMIDKLLETVQDVSVVRGEVCSYASSIRRNKDRLPSSLEKLTNKKMGHRQDLIIRRNETLELGVGEEKSYDNNTNMILERGMKCPKAMKDTLLQLFENVNYDSNLRKSLNVIGLLTFGLTLYIDILDNPVNYTCRITRSNNFTVPYKIEDLSENILPLLSALLSLKSIITNNSIMLSSSQDARQKLKSSLKRSFNNTEDSRVIPKISCATTPEDNGRFVSVTRKNQKRREN
ncbi:hypothetical protein INT48_009634 [Thamnidium elegans]|uniref:Uncharacterized protein n=1 Tax=Thamnidium elegans TaxID=101142 RepID=A0A8H7VX55_9FUNG|nr:hypothetical protein INT48_009634 [Thamnidium elegans]